MQYEWDGITMDKEVQRKHGKTEKCPRENLDDVSSYFIPSPFLNI